MLLCRQQRTLVCAQRGRCTGRDLSLTLPGPAWVTVDYSSVTLTPGWVSQVQVTAPELLGLTRGKHKTERRNLLVPSSDKGLSTQETNQGQAD